jgi:hypothetical protein
VKAGVPGENGYRSKKLPPFDFCGVVLKMGEVCVKLFRLTQLPALTAYLGKL